MRLIGWHGDDGNNHSVKYENGIAKYDDVVTPCDDMYSVPAVFNVTIPKPVSRTLTCFLGAGSPVAIVLFFTGTPVTYG